MKSKAIKAILAIVMALTVAVLCMPMAMAAETSGSCGESATWSYNESTKELKIEGTGVAEWVDEWSKFDESLEEPATATVKSVVISDGITDVSALSFQGWFSLTKVTVPASVTATLSEAFVNQTSVSEIVFKGTMAQWEKIMPEYLMGYEGYEDPVQPLKVSCTDGTIEIVEGVIESLNSYKGTNTTNASETTTTADKAEKKADDKAGLDNTTLIIIIAAVAVVTVIAAVTIVLSKKKK